MENKNLDNLRHSCAHLLAKAVLELWPGSHNAIGPSIENGFYQDFDMGDVKISDGDLARIDQKMREIVKSWHPFTFREVTLDEALKLFKNNPYKIELAKEFAGDGKKLSANDPGGFLDLCKMGHVDNPAKDLKNFKLLSVAGAYWRGSEKNKMLTRIYGTAFPTKDELQKYLIMLEEAKKRDHRKLGKELELFTISEQVGAGLPIFLPKGATVRKLIENYLEDSKKKNGYQFVWSPHIAKSQIYHTSGHWGKYDAMFASMKLDEEEYVLKPMNCPHHFQVYMTRPRSYKELPFRIAENSTVYRHEKSGEVSGLLRVRSLTIDDTHTFIRLSQTKDEMSEVLKMIKEILERFGFKNYRARISTSDPKNPDKYLGERKNWVEAEKILEDVAKKLFENTSIGVGEAAFYGPKIDVMVKDSLGREWQLSTVQLDYNQPKNFEMKYIDEEGKEQYPAILHIAMIGSIERLMGILIEHYAGAFPLWLAPVQVGVIPVSDKFAEYAQKITDELKKNNIRVELNVDKETVGKKIRQSTLQKHPYMVIIGEREVESYKLDKVYKVSVRTREGKDLGTLELNSFIQQLREQIEKYLL